VTKRVVDTGDKAPAKARLLGVTVTGALGVERIDGRTLALEFAEGFPQEPLSRFFRDPKVPFAPGQSVDLDGFHVRVESCDADGNATRVVYRFDVPLEDPSLAWIVWEKGAFARYVPPRVGARETRAPIAFADLSRDD